MLLLLFARFKPHLEEQGPGAAQRKTYRPHPEGEAPAGVGEETGLMGAGKRRRGERKEKRSLRGAVPINCIVLGEKESLGS
jgi:hypothetical protein